LLNSNSEKTVFVVRPAGLPSALINILPCKLPNIGLGKKKGLKTRKGKKGAHVKY